MSLSRQIVLLLAIGCALHCSWAFAADPPRNLAVQLDSGNVVGLPIHWGSLDAAILESSGRIEVFEQHQVRQHQLLDTAFSPISLAAARSQLKSELGNGFDTLITGPYVIAAPSGEIARWEAIFRKLLGGYQRYFETRGWALRTPDFPLSVIVLPDQAAFHQMAAQEAGHGFATTNLAGMYLTRSNRCLLYHLQAGKETDWESTESTIVHEAVHQLAYNTGVHERLFQHPVWMVEGLATMFEVSAVYDTKRQSTKASDRVNPTQLAILLQAVGRDHELLGQLFEELVSNDQLFRSEPPLAYAAAWALTFYISERMPRQYFEYIAMQRQRGFDEYTAELRQLDFRRAFGTAPADLAPQIVRMLAP